MTKSGRITDHRIRRVECRRDAEEIDDYRLSYHIDITKKEIVDKALRIAYAFSVTYGEGVGAVYVEGELSYKDTPKALRDVEKKWDEQRELQSRVYNVIFRNSVIMVMDMARHVGLPSPVPLPRLQPGDFQS